MPTARIVYTDNTARNDNTVNAALTVHNAPMSARYTLLALYTLITLYSLCPLFAIVDGGRNCMHCAHGRTAGIVYKCEHCVQKSTRVRAIVGIFTGLYELVTPVMMLGCAWTEELLWVHRRLIRL